MDRMLLNFGARLGRCWTELMRPLPKTIRTLVLTIGLILLACVALGFLAYGLARGGHIPAENESAGLAISGACGFAIVAIAVMLCCLRLYRKRRNSAAAIPLREVSRITANDVTFVEVASGQDSPGGRTPISISSDPSASVGVTSCGRESSEGTSDQLAVVEVHNVICSESDQPAEEQQNACSEENPVKEEPVSADEQVASNVATSAQQQEPQADTTLII